MGRVENWIAVEGYDEQHAAPQKRLQSQPAKHSSGPRLLSRKLIGDFCISFLKPSSSQKSVSASRRIAREQVVGGCGVLETAATRRCWKASPRSAAPALLSRRRQQNSS